MQIASLSFKKKGRPTTVSGPKEEKDTYLLVYPAMALRTGLEPAREGTSSPTRFPNGPTTNYHIAAYGADGEARTLAWPFGHLAD